MSRLRNALSHGLRNRKLAAVAGTAAALFAFGAAIAEQDRYSLQVPGGLAFSEFKGYEDWQAVSVSQTDHAFALILANPVMIEAYRAGVPGNGQPFPDGPKIVKLQWKPKKSPEAPFEVDVPDVFTQAL